MSRCYSQVILFKCSTYTTWHYLIIYRCKTIYLTKVLPLCCTLVYRHTGCLDIEYFIFLLHIGKYHLTQLGRHVTTGIEFVCINTSVKGVVVYIRHRSGYFDSRSSPVVIECISTDILYTLLHKSYLGERTASGKSKTIELRYTRREYYVFERCTVAKCTFGNNGNGGWQ